MSAYWIAERLRAVANIVVQNKTKLSLSLEGTSKPIHVYVVDNDYCLDQEIVSRAIEEGDEHIVYFSVTRPTTAGAEFAKTHGVKIWPIGKFLTAVSKGRI
ncbi:MAG: hypothetical protein WA117_03825 [Verrucomicrobiia bacterium]